jgi:starch synthase
MPTAPLQVLFVCSECAPWAKTGGLADVAAALPAALRALGVDARLLLPAYRSVPTDGARTIEAFAATAHFPPARLLSASLPNGVPALLLECPQLYDRAGGPYQDEAGADWSDNARRFAQLSRIAAAVSSGRDAPAWVPDIVHCNDWQTGLVPAYLRFSSARRAASVLTIHNLAFQGVFPASTVEAAELPPASFSVEGLEFYGQCSFLKGGLSYSDELTTVSPTYAAEIQQEAYGMGLHGLLASRKDTLTGILNGIDTDVWDPARDPHIARAYDATTLDAKAANKRALQKRAGLAESDAPLLAMVSRLTQQKGIDFVLEIGAEVAAMPAQLVILGRGEAQYESGVAALARSHPGRIGASVSFDETLAHLIEAGADAFLMPSRFEPCGMNQMYSQRYGTPPIVRATGGLADSVEDYSPATGSGSGFVFREPTAGALLGAIRRAIAVYRDGASWRRLQGNCMARDFSWHASARRYVEIYRRALARTRP